MKLLRQLHAPQALGTALAVALGSLLVFSACSVNVKKDNQGQEKHVDIDTPVGGIHVSKDADARDTGLPVYPGARVKEKEENGDVKSANVDISTGFFGLKVIAVEYESDAAPDKLIAYYKDALKKYGTVLECHTSKHADVTMERGGDHSGSHALKCDSNDHGNRVELKVGTEENQHLVSIEPEGKGSSFALVVVQTRGRDTI